MTTGNKRYFLFGWNNDDEWHDENDWEIGFMITGLALHKDNKTVQRVLMEWDTIIFANKNKVLTRDFQNIGVFEIDDYKKHREEFRILIDESSGLQYCEFKPRTTCIKLVKIITLSDVDEFWSWLETFDIMTFNEYRDEFMEKKRKETLHQIKKNKPTGECTCRSSCLQEDTPEEVRNQILYAIFLIVVVAFIVVMMLR